MAEDEGKARKGVEEPGEDETKEMRDRVHGEAPGCRRDLLVTREIGLRRGMRVARMEIDRHAQGLGRLEDRPEFLIVEKFAIAVAVDHRALETPILDRALELLDCSRDIGRRQG